MAFGTGIHNWTVETCLCSQSESWLVFSVLVAEHEDVLDIDLAKSTLYLVLALWLVPDSINK